MKFYRIIKSDRGNILEGLRELPWRFYLVFPAHWENLVNLSSFQKYSRSVHTEETALEASIQRIRDTDNVEQLPWAPSDFPPPAALLPKRIDPRADNICARPVNDRGILGVLVLNTSNIS